MKGVQTTIALPADVYAALSANGYADERLEKGFKLHLAAGLFRKKLLSLAKASELADIGIWEFIDFLGDLDIPVIDYDDEEIKDVINTGFAIPVKYGRIGKAKMYDFNQTRHGEYYEQKRVEVVYAVEKDIIITVTVYVFYGKWEGEDADFV